MNAKKSYEDANGEVFRYQCFRLKNSKRWICYRLSTLE